MTPEEFNNYSKEEQELIFLEMCKLYTIIETNPIGIEELLMFAEWQRVIAKWGHGLKDFLSGVYPHKALLDLNQNDCLSEFDYNNEINRIKKLSNEALNFVAYWNRVVHQQY